VYRTLQSEKIVETAEAMAAQVRERFPGSGLSRVGEEIVEVARRAHERTREIRRPDVPLRVAIAAFLAVGLFALALTITQVTFHRDMLRGENFFEEMNSALGVIVLLGAAVAFLFSLETRRKRAKALEAVNELRALAHVIDMHQLTKDSYHVRDGTASMTALQSSRYFECCSELLSVTAKVGALYAQGFPDPVALEAVDDLEELCLGLSHKVWQKIMIVGRAGQAHGSDDDDS